MSNTRPPWPVTASPNSLIISHAGPKRRHSNWYLAAGRARFQPNGLIDFWPGARYSGPKYFDTFHWLARAGSGQLRLGGGGRPRTVSANTSGAGGTRHCFDWRAGPRAPIVNCWSICAPPAGHKTRASTRIGRAHRWRRARRWHANWPPARAPASPATK